MHPLHCGDNSASARFRTMQDSPPFPRPGSSLYHALRTVPPGRRPTAALWLQWWHEVSQIPYTVSDPGVAESKLRWWLAEIQRAAEQKAEHPLMQRIQAQAHASPESWPQWSLWTQQLQGLIQLTQQTRWLDDASLQRHARETTGAATESIACLLGAGTEAARTAACQLGVGLRQAHQLARLGQDARAGWVNVAIDVLQTHDVRAHQLSKPDPHQAPPGWTGLVNHLHGQARASIEQGLNDLRALPSDQQRALRPLLVLAHLHLALIDTIAASGDLVLHQRVMLTPLRKGWITQKVQWGWLN